jgi:hypothetical protein
MINEQFNDGASLRSRWQVHDGSEKVTDCCSMPTSLLSSARKNEVVPGRVPFRLGFLRIALRCGPPCARSFEKAWPARQGGLIPRTRQLFGNQRPYANAEFVICSVKLRDCVFDDAGCPPTIPSTTRASIHRSSLSFGHMHARLHRLRLETTCDLIPPACSPRFVRKGAESRILYRSGRSARPVLPVPTMRSPFAGASIGVFQPARILRDQRIRWHNACC